jgi:methyl-accepting chemotaxis protein
MDDTFEQLELEKKNASLLKNHMRNNDYIDFIKTSVVLIDELPDRIDRIHVLWNRKNDLADRLDTLRKKLLLRKNHILFQAKQHISQLYKNQSLWLIASFLAILIMYIAAGLRVSRSISRPLNRIIRGVDNISRQTAVAAAQFTNSSQNLAQNASEQASSIEQITATLEQLSAMSQETTKLTQGADELMNQNIIKSGQSLKSFVELTRRMKQVEADSDKIDQIISDIDGIAFQTNLLALNAAVEAARAGEAGSGFGVVAEEVRNLAKKTAEAAQNTQNLLRGTVTGISEAVKTIQTINSDFEGIIESATVMGEKTEAITSASKEQSLGIEQITISAGEIDQSTQQIAASSQQSASASEQLNSQARQMNHYVIELSTLIRGKTESPEKPETNKGATGFVQARPASTRVNRR